MNRQFDVDRSDVAQNFERSTRILRHDKNGCVRLEQRSAKLPRQPPNFSQEHFTRRRFGKQPVSDRMGLLCHLNLVPKLLSSPGEVEKSGSEILKITSRAPSASARDDKGGDAVIIFVCPQMSAAQNCNVAAAIPSPD